MTHSAYQHTLGIPKWDRTTFRGKLNHDREDPELYSQAVHKPATVGCFIDYRTLLRYGLQEIVALILL